jgi:uronate dehydrogenase
LKIGVTKCFGEALCRYMGEKEGVPSIAIRIGAFQPPSSAKGKEAIGMMDSWLSERDCVQLIERCIDAPEDLKFAIVHGLSRNTFNRMDIQSTRELLGYEPEDNFFEESEFFQKLNMAEKLSGHNVEYVEKENNVVV